jgi:hypothetical protein
MDANTAYTNLSRAVERLATGGQALSGVDETIVASWRALNEWL